MATILQHSNIDQRCPVAGNPFLLAPEVNANPLLSDSWSRCQRYGLDPATEDFPRLGAGELADRLASHRGLQQLAQPVVKPCRAGRRPAVGGDPFRPRRHGAAYSRRYRALQRPSAWRWLPAICGVKAGAGPTPSAPRWRLTMAARSMAVSTFLPATRICTARRCRSSDRTEASPGCWISPVRRIFPTSTPLAG